MNHTDIINYLIEKYNYQSYLEIGLGEAVNFLRVNCKNKECVDPYEGESDRNDSIDVNDFILRNILTYRMTSDKFFSGPGISKKYDIIFIDGLHQEEQVDRDILNSLQHLNEGGRIVIHDCLPPREEIQQEERCEGEWNGTTWKSIPKLALMGVEYLTVDVDYGCCIVEYKENPESLTLPLKADYDYKTVFSSNVIKTVAMRIINEEGFYKIY